MVVERRPQIIDYSEESQADKLARKAKEAPFVPIGLAGCAGAVLYGIYSYKNRGEMSTSVYLMKFRVVAQSAVVLALGIGIGYSMLDQYVFPKFQTPAIKKEETNSTL